jgi:DNA-binding MurR/RpiR family transcriptional regulator
MTTFAPKDFDSLRAAIMEQRGALPKRLMQVAAYALEHPDDIAFGTTASIAQAAQVQPSTLVRFAQSFGFDGFSGLQQLFQARLKDRNSSYEDRLRQLELGGAAETESGTIVSGFINAAHQSLDALNAALEPDRLERAVDILARAETIYLIARRRSFPIVTSMAYALGKLKVRYQMVSSAAGNDDDLLDLATSKDAAFAVSFTPYAAESVSQAQVLAQRGVQLVALTDSALSPLVAHAEVWFELMEADHAGFRSLSASLTLAMALTVSLAERRRQL